MSQSRKVNRFIIAFLVFAGLIAGLGRGAGNAIATSSAVEPEHEQGQSVIEGVSAETVQNLEAFEIAYRRGDMETAAAIAKKLPFEQQATLAQTLHFEQAEELQPAVLPQPEMTQADEQQALQQALADGAQAIADAAETRKRARGVPDAGDADTSASEPGTSNRQAATLTVGDNCTYSTIQAAVSAASSTQTTTIRVQAKTFTGFDATVNINGRSVVIDGGYNSSCTTKTSNHTILDATGDIDSVIEIAGATSTITLKDLTLRNGQNDADFGGGIEISSNPHTVTLDSMLIQENSSTYGGAVHMTDGATLNLENGTRISLNSATQNGGGIFCMDGEININDSSYIGYLFTAGSFPVVDEPNNANSSGGGVYADNCDVILGRTGFAGIWNNEAYSGGGVFAVNDSYVWLRSDYDGRGSISFNEVDTGGGGVALFTGSRLFVDDGDVNNNTADLSGGGVWAHGTNVYVDFDSDVTPCSMATCAHINSNSAVSQGGGIYATGGARVDFKVAYARNNSAGQTGSFIYAASDDTVVSLDSVMITDNTTANHVIHLAGSSSAGGPIGTVSNVTIAGTTGMSVNDGVLWCRRGGASGCIWFNYLGQRHRLTEYGRW